MHRNWALYGAKRIQRLKERFEEPGVELAAPGRTMLEEPAGLGSARGEHRIFSTKRNP
jgi:hypothetical protein